MTRSSEPPAVPRRARLPRRTARVRLTALYGGLFTVSGVVLLAFTYGLFERATAATVLVDRHNTNKLTLLCTAILGHVAQGRGIPPQCLRFLQLQSDTLDKARGVDLHTLLAQSGLALAVTVVLSITLGWFVAGRVLRPLRDITATARRISATSLHERLALDGPDDEFKELADTLDELLGRLEASFQAQRHFVANASHELRTPLTLERALLQVALRDRGATVQQWRSTGEELLDNGRQQERLLEALLTLATSEGGLGHREPVDLAAVVEAGLRTARPGTGCARLRSGAVLQPACLLGDPGLVERLVANLLDNAVRHNLPGGAVEISTGTRDGHAILSVANGGPVIPPADVGRLFQPFQRLSPARAGEDSGHGLGLSIVQAIANAHGAALTADAPPGGGLRIEVAFPPGAAVPGAAVPGAGPPGAGPGAGAE
jgi:signal transduction histidine kinase